MSNVSLSTAIRHKQNTKNKKNSEIVDTAAMIWYKYQKQEFKG